MGGDAGLIEPAKIEKYKLAESAKSALRKYMLTLLILPSALLAAVGFVLRYAINDLAKGEAYVAAFDKASDHMFRMAVNAGRALDDAEEAQEEAGKMIEVTKKSRAVIEKIHRRSNEAVRKMDSITVFDIADKNVETIAESVLEKGNLEQRIVAIVDQRLTEAENRITEAEKGLNKKRVSGKGEMTNVHGGMPWGTWRDVTYCPDDHYVCGLSQRVESKQGKGDDTAINDLRMWCCKF